jgi:hypothetical protein
VPSRAVAAATKRRDPDAAGSARYAVALSEDSLTHRLSLLLALVVATPAWAADGVDLDADNSVAIADLPAPIKATIQERWPGAEIQSAETEKKFFDVTIATVRGDNIEVLFTARGKVKRIEEKTTTEGGGDDEDEPSERDEEE